MPIFFQQNIDDSTRLAVWRIEEEEGFFLERVPLQRSIVHPHKRLQHLAGRYLLQYLFPDFPIQLIQIADTRKPYLEDEAYHFSISHCASYAAVIVSKEKRVGVDIEIVSEKVYRIKDKFSTEEEQRLLLPGEKGTQSEESALSFFTLVWSCKEAVFKWYGKGEVDFRKHIHIQRIQQTGSGEAQSVICFKKNEDRLLDLHSLLFTGTCLSYTVTSN